MLRSPSVLTYVLAVDDFVAVAAAPSFYSASIFHANQHRKCWLKKCKQQRQNHQLQVFVGQFFGVEHIDNCFSIIWHCQSSFFIPKSYRNIIEMLMTTFNTFLEYTKWTHFCSHSQDLCLVSVWASSDVCSSTLLILNWCVRWRKDSRRHWRAHGLLVLQ